MRVAIWEMMRGRYKKFLARYLELRCWVERLAAIVVVRFGKRLVGFMARHWLCVGMMLYEHAYVQAGQSVPLA